MVGKRIDEIHEAMQGFHYPHSRVASHHYVPAIKTNNDGLFTK